MRKLCRPALSNVTRSRSSSGVLANFTYTSVPPRKSTLNGTPCQNSMENTPATLNTSEKARKYHFLPRKSIFVSRKNSTCPNPLRIAVDLNTERFAAFLFAQNPIENYARNKHRRKQVRQQTKNQGDGKSLDRPRPENKQDRCRNNRGYVGIHNRDPSPRKPLLDGRRRRSPSPQLFADALKNQHVRVNTHTDGQNDAGNSG